MNKKIYTSLIFGLIFFASASSALALEPFRRIDTDFKLITSPTPTATAGPLLIKPNLIKEIKVMEYKYMNKRTELLNVTVVAKDATSITVDNGEASIKVTFQANTHYRRKFWGKSSPSEISIGDKVDVIGRWANEEKTEVKAVLIRNLSIQRRYGAFFGEVKSINDTGFVMTTIHRGEETVTIDASTKLINREEKAILASDILVGHKVRIKGLWDSVKFTITQVAEIKDFSIPPKPISSPEAE